MADIQPEFVRENMREQTESGPIKEFYDKVRKLHPEGIDCRQAQVDFCQEFINMVDELGAEKLEPYFYKVKSIRFEGGIEISFKFPSLSYDELLHPRW